MGYVSHNTHTHTHTHTHTTTQPHNHTHNVRVHKPTSRVVTLLVIYSCNVASSPQVGLFGAVITTKEHQRKGLSKTCVRKTLERWDRFFKKKSILILGTGSPHAAKVYAKHGFKHLNGGLDSGKKGYNPDDKGEWIMIRGEFDASTYVYFSCHHHDKKKIEGSFGDVRTQTNTGTILRLKCMLVFPLRRTYGAGLVTSDGIAYVVFVEFRTTF